MGYMDLPPEIQEKMLAEQEKQTEVIIDGVKYII